MAQVGHAIGGDLPEMRVEHLERDIAVVADPPEVLDDRPELEVSLAGQDPVAVAGQLARGAAQVADLHPGQVLRGQVRRGPRTCSDRCSNGTRRGRRRRCGCPTARSGPAPFRGRHRTATSFETRARSARRTSPPARRPRRARGGPSDSPRALGLRHEVGSDDRASALPARASSAEPTSEVIPVALALARLARGTSLPETPPRPV